MDIFGAHWTNHHQKIKADWEQKVTDNDIVIVAGDISWAITEEEAHADLSWIDELPGRKIFVKGNHDYWWKSLSKLQGKYKTIDFIQNNAFCYNDIVFCGSRGWMMPGSDGFTDNDLKIYNREVMRLEMSIKEAKKCKDPKEIIVVTHYPPITKQVLNTNYNQVIRNHHINHVVYGHLHDENSWANTIVGEHDGINYYLTSCDYLDFKLIEITI